MKTSLVVNTVIPAFDVVASELSEMRSVYINLGCAQQRVRFCTSLPRPQVRSLHRVFEVMPLALSLCAYITFLFWTPFDDWPLLYEGTRALAKARGAHVLIRTRWHHTIRAYRPPLPQGWRLARKASAVIKEIKKIKKMYSSYLVKRATTYLVSPSSL